MSELATAPAQVTRMARIDGSIDKQALGQMVASNTVGGMNFQNMMEVMEFSKLMSVSDVAVPKHLRGNPGACLAVCIQALEWRMSPYAVANKSYVVNDRIGYESQLIHAVIEQRAPIIGRLRNRFIGEGDSRRCVVWATAKGESQPLEYISSEFGRIQPKNSPLWKTKPDLQLFYNASRDWARMYFPDVIMGVYSEDELADATKETAVNKLNEKLREVAPPARITSQETTVIEPLSVETHSVVTDADAEAATAEPPAEAEPEDLSDHGKFRQLCQLAAADQGMGTEDFDKAFAALGVSTKIKSVRRSEWEPARTRVLAAFRAGVVGVDGTIPE